MDNKTVEKVAKLARIQLEKDEVAALSRDLSGILKWVEQLAEVDTSKSEAEIANEVKLRFRADEVTAGNQIDDILKNAPNTQFGCFVVPKVIE